MNRTASSRRKRTASTTWQQQAGARKRRSVASSLVEEANPKNMPSPAVAPAAGGSRYATRSQTRRNLEKLSVVSPTRSSAVVLDDGKTSSNNYCRVYVEAGSGRRYSVTLTRCSIDLNQNNFYQIQVLEYSTKKPKEFHVVFKHGRIGHVPTVTSVNAASCSGAMALFHSKFHALTKNKWVDRQFRHVDGCYDMIDLKVGDSDDEPTTPSIINHQLSQEERALMKLILGEKPFSAKLFRDMSNAIGRTPLGKISREQVAAGYACLKRIRSSKYNSQDEMVKACNNFYTKIPHFFSKQRKPTLVRGDSKLKEKSLLLDTLADPAYAKLAQLFQRCNSDEFSHDIIDMMYSSLKYRPRHLDKNSSKDYAWIKTCVTNTHGQSHNWYTLEVTDVFELQPRDNDVFRSDLDNRFMLWHGSKITNWHGILRNGLRIEPVEAISSGSMFGSGVYFADMVSKAANYCQPSCSSYTPLAVGLLLLCEVALGTMTHRYAATQNNEQSGPRSHDQSVKGVGKTQPDPAHRFVLKNGAVVHMGRPCVNEAAENVSDLMYNEYVVYNSDQIRPAYVVAVTFTS